MSPPIAYGKTTNNGACLQLSFKPDAAKKLAKFLQAGEQDPHVPPKIFRESDPDPRRF